MSIAGCGGESFGLFAEQLVGKLGELCYSLVLQHEDAVAEKHAKECGRIHNARLEQELELRAEVASLQEKNEKLLQKVSRLQERIGSILASNSGVACDVGASSASAGESKTLQKGPSIGAHSALREVASSAVLMPPTSYTPVTKILPGAIPEDDSCPPTPGYDGPHGASQANDEVSTVHPTSDVEELTKDKEAEDEACQHITSTTSRRPSLFRGYERKSANYVSTTDARRLSRSLSEGLINFVGSLEATPQLLRTYTIHPSSQISRAKDALSVMCLFWDCLTLPYILAWDPASMGWKVVAAYMCVFWTCEMLMSMNTGYFSDGVLHMRRRDAILHYASRWLFIDVVTVSLDWFGMSLELYSVSHELSYGWFITRPVRLFKMYRLLNLARALRAMKVYERLATIGRAITCLYATGAWALMCKLAQYAIAVLWFNHLIACCWFAIGIYASSDTETGSTWLDDYRVGDPEGGTLLHRSSPFSQYVVCLHFALSNTLLGTLSSVVPTNSLERAFTASCVFIGFIWSAFLISNLSSWLVHRQFARQDKVAAMCRLRRYLRENTVADNLASRIDGHVSKLINETPRLREEEVDALGKLTPALLAELRKDMYAETLRSDPVFRTLECLDISIMESLCVSALRPTYYERGQLIFNPLSKSGRAFVVNSGSVHYMKAVVHRTSQIKMKKDVGAPESTARRVQLGTWMSPAAVWMEWKHLGEAEAQADTHLLELSSSAVKLLLEPRAQVKAIMASFAEVYEQKISVLDREDLSDIGFCVEHAAVVLGMDYKRRMYISFAVLHKLQERYAFRSRFGLSFTQLEQEVQSGSRAIVFDSQGRFQHVKHVVSLRLRRPDGRVLMQISSRKGDRIDNETQLLSYTLTNEEPEEGLSKLLSADFACLGSALTLGQVSTFTTRTASKTFASLAVPTMCIKTVYSATLGGNVVLPRKQDARRAAEYLRDADANLHNAEMVREVHKLMNGAQEEVICIWVDPEFEESLSKRNREVMNVSKWKRPLRRFPTVDKPGKSPKYVPPVTAVVCTAPKRVPVPTTSAANSAAESSGLTGLPLLRSLLKDRKTDWYRARRMATRICDPEYSCEDFFNDCIVAFPELGLYVIGTKAEATDVPTIPSPTTGGNTADEEYQRTMGAFFAFFWLMRLDLEGADSFSFGLDEGWQPRIPPSDSTMQTEEVKRRSMFRQHADWDAMHQLLIDAGIIRQTAAASESQHDPERTLAMLSLTAYHDIMKVQALLPTVAPEHGSWYGFAAGEIIDDHDAALGYVLEYYPEVLPSFEGLPTAAQRSIRFTQCKMEYNMGWLVQAEAPPGALLTTLRNSMLSGSLQGRDLSFYFVHWFTDLAGAVPTPMAGSEKFVLSFPLKVMGAFLNSCAIVGDLGDAQSEAQVYENYLRWRWETHKPPLGRIPEGTGAIAKMRLVIMAQGNSKLLMSAWRQLSDADRRILGEELARTGCEGQRYNCDTLMDPRGPSFLVYYGPALLQKAGLLDPLGALRMLAEIFRQARALWPLKSTAGGVTITVRIDLLKSETVHACSTPPKGKAWCLEKVSERSCAVTLANLSSGEDWGSRIILNFINCADGAAVGLPKPAGVLVDDDEDLDESEVESSSAVGALVEQLNGVVKPPLGQ